jgi:hypothetical protein
MPLIKQDSVIDPTLLLYIFGKIAQYPTAQFMLNTLLTGQDYD